MFRCGLFRELLLRATEAVRARLLALAGPESRDQIQRVLAAISEDAGHEAHFSGCTRLRGGASPGARDADLGRTQRSGHLRVCEIGRHADMVAAISALCGAPVKLVEICGRVSIADLYPARPEHLSGRRFACISTCRSIGRKMSDQDLDAARTDYFSCPRTMPRGYFDFGRSGRQLPITLLRPLYLCHRPWDSSELRDDRITQF